MARIAFKEKLKKSTSLTNVVRVLRDGAKTNYEILQQLRIFAPSSKGSLRSLSGLALQSAHQTFPLICSLVRANCQSLSTPTSIETIFSHKLIAVGLRKLQNSLIDMEAISHLCTTIIFCMRHCWRQSGAIGCVYSNLELGLTPQTWFRPWAHQENLATRCAPFAIFVLMRRYSVPTSIGGCSSRKTAYGHIT
jgi:hypothetical protein